jgi:hypothetical protein
VDPKDEYLRAFDDRLRSLDALDDAAKTIVQVMRNTANPETRVKQLAELRSIDANRLKLYDEMDGILEAIQAL